MEKNDEGRRRRGGGGGGGEKVGEEEEARRVERGREIRKENLNSIHRVFFFSGKMKGRGTGRRRRKGRTRNFASQWCLNSKGNAVLG